VSKSQVVSETWTLPCRRSRSATLCRRTSVQRFFQHNLFRRWDLTDVAIVMIDGEFEAAEPHLLASGQRDSARLLADLMVDWSAAGSTPGLFALRGTIPYVSSHNIRTPQC
jgi:hypothetical protein